MGKQWRFAVVGMGTIGEHHRRAIRSIPGATVVAACDAAPDRARARLSKSDTPDLPLYPNLAELLKKEKVDVVNICTPSGDHLDPAKLAMQHGAHVICEKPLEVTLERIDDMIATAQKHNVRLAGIFQSRWERYNQAIKQAINEGRFGTLAWAGAFTPWFRTEEYYAGSGWRGTWKYDGGGAMMNQSIHTVDLLQWLIGPIRRVSAYAGKRTHPSIEVEDTLTCAAEFQNGAFGTIMGTTSMFPGGPVRVEIGGELGSVMSESGLRRFEFKDARPQDKTMLEELSPERIRATAEKSPAGWIDAHTQNIQASLQAWEKGEEAPTSGSESRGAVATILAMYESARKGGAPVGVR